MLYSFILPKEKIYFIITMKMKMKNDLFIQSIELCEMCVHKERQRQIIIYYF